MEIAPGSEDFQPKPLSLQTQHACIHRQAAQSCVELRGETGDCITVHLEGVVLAVEGGSPGKRHRLVLSFCGISYCDPLTLSYHQYYTVGVNRKGTRNE